LVTSNLQIISPIAFASFCLTFSSFKLLKFADGNPVLNNDKTTTIKDNNQGNAS
jgi:hypothetical protein